MIPLAMSVPPIQICVIINPCHRFQVDLHPAIGLAGGAPGVPARPPRCPTGETPVSPLPSAESATPGAASVILYKPLMATSTRNTSRSAAPAIIDNYERERVFNLFRQFGYLEAELNPLGLLPPQPHPDLRL